MKIPCVERVGFVVTGLSFLIPSLTNAQFYNFTLIATALILGAKFNLSEINRMWLKEKAVSTLSYLLSEAKISIPELELLYAKRMQEIYGLEDGFYCVDDTMEHHTSFCKLIYGVFVLFDHALKTNLKCMCIVVLYYTDGALLKFPIKFAIYHKEAGKKMPWQVDEETDYTPKYALGIEMLEWALKVGFPRGIVLADSWFGIEPFIKELKRLRLGYVIEIKSNYKIRQACKKPKLTKTGRLSKNQTETIRLAEYFESVESVVKCGFGFDRKTNKKEKVLYHTKAATLRLNAIGGKHRIIQSFDPIKQTTKYLLTDKLTWEASRILTVYSHRWVIEEFFRNAKQLTDMEGATVRSKQAVTIVLWLVFWIDALLHLENYKQCTCGKLPKEPLTIPSVVRKAEFENMKAFIERARNDEDFIKRWLAVEMENITRKRKPRKELITIDDYEAEQSKLAA